MRRPEEDDRSHIIQDPCVRWIIVRINNHLCRSDTFAERGTFFAINPPMLCTTNIVGRYKISLGISECYEHHHFRYYQCRAHREAALQSLQYQVHSLVRKCSCNPQGSQKLQCEDLETVYLHGEGLARRCSSVVQSTYQLLNPLIREREPR